VDASGIYQTQWTGGPAAKQPAGGGAGGGASGSGSPGPGFQVDSDGIRQQAATIADCGQQIAQVLDNLRAALTSGGEPWGNDDLGQQFGASYTDPANQGFGSLAGLGTAVTNVANQLVTQANNYDGVEQHIANSFTSLNGQSGSAGSAGSPGSSASSAESA
jgi:uncharacterized protein YukE